MDRAGPSSTLNIYAYFPKQKALGGGGYYVLRFLPSHCGTGRSGKIAGLHQKKGSKRVLFLFPETK